LETSEEQAPLRIVLPKGRIATKVREVLEQVGYGVSGGDRSYRPRCEAAGVTIKLVKPQNIPQLLALGRHDLGFSGHDWVVEQSADVQDVLDLGFDPVQIVAAVPNAIKGTWMSLGRPLVVATEYQTIAQSFLNEHQLEGVIVRTYGATEVFPPEDADMIVDNSATGETLRQNGLHVVETLLRSSTRMLVSPAVRDDPGKQSRIGDLKALIQAVLLARRKVLIEMNVPRDKIDVIVDALPAMRAPTVSPLHGESGFAVKIAIDRDAVPALLLQAKALGASDILAYDLKKIVP
jgi:ATP phosphoribosyltransferase